MASFSVKMSKYLWHYWRMISSRCFSSSGSSNWSLGPCSLIIASWASINVSPLVEFASTSSSLVITALMASLIKRSSSDLGRGSGCVTLVCLTTKSI